MHDITFTQDGDVELGLGDITYTESTGQHKRDLLLSDRGHVKEFPGVGIGVNNFLHDTDPENFFRTIRKECTKDGMKVYRVGAEAGEIIIDAEYENNNR